jgi:hypothetical protein
MAAGGILVVHGGGRGDRRHLPPSGGQGVAGQQGRGGLLGRRQALPLRGVARWALQRGPVPDAGVLPPGGDSLDSWCFLQKPAALFRGGSRAGRGGGDAHSRRSDREAGGHERPAGAAATARGRRPGHPVVARRSNRADGDRGGWRRRGLVGEEVRALRDCRAARRGGDGAGLPGFRPGARPQRRGQAPLRRQPEAGGPLPPGGAGPGPGRARAHLQGVRGGGV